MEILEGSLSDYSSHGGYFWLGKFVGSGSTIISLFTYGVPSPYSQDYPSRWEIIVLA